MKKRVIFVLCMMLFLFGGICIGKLPSKEPEVNSTPQKVVGNYGGGRLYVVAETDKDIYEGNEYIHVTITLINRSDEAMEIFMPTSAKGVNQGLSTIIEKDGTRLINVDTYIIDDTQEERTLLLETGEKYIQFMRFSVNKFNNQSGELVYTEDKLSTGTYKGIVTVNVIEEKEIVPFSVEFAIEIREK